MTDFYKAIASKVPFETLLAIGCLTKCIYLVARSIYNVEKLRLNIRGRAVMLDRDVVMQCGTQARIIN